MMVSLSIWAIQTEFLWTSILEGRGFYKQMNIWKQSSSIFRAELYCGHLRQVMQHLMEPLLSEAATYRKALKRQQI